MNTHSHLLSIHWHIKDLLILQSYVTQEPQST